MNGRNGSSHPRILMMATLGVVVLGAVHTVHADEGDALKWTPHRASTARTELEAESRAPAADDATPRRDASSPNGAPASVTLPDEVPVIDTAPEVRRTLPAMGNRPMRPAPPQPEARGTASRFYDPANPEAVFGVRVMRTPPPPSNQPRVAMTPRDRQGSPTDNRLGGGLAPRYQQTRSAAGQRPERLAMNVDGIPSVMTQPPATGPEAALPPGIAVPGRTADERIPTPANSVPGEPSEVESIGPGIEMPLTGPPDELVEGGIDGYGSEGAMGDGLLMGDYPTELHVESFYDDPYACDDEESELSFCYHDGRICRWLRQFGRPYYGWRWHRDFSASAGVTSFTNATDLGLNGNFGTNEYLNWAMPFWNAFGTGWQLGVRGVQSNFQPATLEIGGTTISKNARDQQFITTGFFTRAFEGRGLQGGIVYDHLHDSWFENTDLGQLRYEMSYVWGYHEFGFWGASNAADELGVFGNQTPDADVASTLSLYTGFYRVQFGDANELKIWGGGTSEQDGIIGALVRAPMHRSLAVEGTFTYVIPDRNHTVTVGTPGEETTFSPAAWNVSLNLVWYPSARSRRGLASPYRPLFEVADNGSMIRAIEGLGGP